MRDNMGISINIAKYCLILIIPSIERFENKIASLLHTNSIYVHSNPKQQYKIVAINKYYGNTHKWIVYTFLIAYE